MRRGMKSGRALDRCELGQKQGFKRNENGQEEELGNGSSPDRSKGTVGNKGISSSRCKKK